MSPSGWAPDEVLTRWQESGDDDSSEAQLGLATAPYQYPQLTVASDGSSDALVLHWFGGPSDAIKWQYRQGVWDGDNQRWGEWMDIPGSDSTTRSHRIKGLEGGQDYIFIVRAIETLEGLSLRVGGRWDPARDWHSCDDSRTGRGRRWGDGVAFP